MIGAIVGDVIGSRFEHNNHRSKNFTLFTKESHFTDDTVCTIATMDWLLDVEERDYSIYLRKWAKMYPDAGYGRMFQRWVYSDMGAYNSFGNGSAMRVSPVPYVYDWRGGALGFADTTARATHNHKEGIKGAQAISISILLALQKKTKEDIKKHITNEFGYNLNLSLPDLIKNNKFDVTCQVTVPQAIFCFLESNSFEDTIRTAISIGGDSDTIANMAGGIAGAFYGIPKGLRDETLNRLPKPMIEVINMFLEFLKKKEQDEYLAHKRFELS